MTFSERVDDFQLIHLKISMGSTRIQSSRSHSSGLRFSSLKQVFKSQSVENTILSEPHCTQKTGLHFKHEKWFYWVPCLLDETSQIDQNRLILAIFWSYCLFQMKTSSRSFGSLWDFVPAFFCHLNHLNLAFFGICINPKGCPSLTFINQHGLGVPISQFLSTQVF